MSTLGVAVVVIVTVAVVISLMIAAAVMASGLLCGPGTAPGGGFNEFTISTHSMAADWVLEIATVYPTPHSITTTTLIIRWPFNATIVDPPGQISFRSLMSQVAGVQYSPVTGETQTDLRAFDVIIISKTDPYASGMQLTIADGSTLLWQGNLP